MFRLTFKNLAANKVRFALTTFGVMLAVSFVVSAFVLGDGLRSSFTRVSEEVTAGVDLEVRNVADFGDAPPLPADTVSAVTAVDGVADAVASIEAADNAVRPIRANGENIPTDGPPQLAFNWIDNDAAEPVHAGRRRAARRSAQFTMDVDSAAKYGFVIGDTYERHGSGWPGRSHPVGNVVVRCRQLDARRRAHADEHRPGERAVRHRRHQQRRRAGRRRRRRRRRSSRGRPQRCRRPRSSTTRRCSGDDLRVHRRDQHRRQHLAGIRWRRTVRVDLHHLQHLRHRVGAADPRARAAAHRRCRPEADSAFGAG